MHVLVTCKYKKDRIKSKRKGGGTIFPIISQWGLSVTSNFDDDSIKNERASMETAFSHYKSMGNFLDAQGMEISFSPL